eukprot:GHVU01094532.1.p1 GENE.GHVU01094532.1~~GHVU01094532.1.p1  ORF type:complete len:214 (+),score=24.14 GHVU01094532.1:726-1367(+)
MMNEGRACKCATAPAAVLDETDPFLSTDFHVDDFAASNFFGEWKPDTDELVEPMEVGYLALTADRMSPRGGEGVSTECLDDLKLMQRYSHGSRAAPHDPPLSPAREAPECSSVLPADEDEPVARPTEAGHEDAAAAFLDIIRLEELSTSLLSPNQHAPVTKTRHPIQHGMSLDLSGGRYLECRYFPLKAEECSLLSSLGEVIQSELKLIHGTL